MNTVGGFVVVAQRPTALSHAVELQTLELNTKSSKSTSGS